jgi:hypothetical protein
MGDRRPERRCRQTWLEAHYIDPQDAEAGDFPACCAKRSRCDWASTAGAGRAAAVLAAPIGKPLLFLAEPLWVGDGAVKVETGFVKFELACFRSLCRLCEKSRDLGRVHRLETADGRVEPVEGLGANRNR